jgi:hypothetical protein
MAQEKHIGMNLWWDDCASYASGYANLRRFWQVMIQSPIADLVRLGVCQPGRRLLAMLALLSEHG